jgi:hypothetical protein
MAVLGRLGASASRYPWRCTDCGLDLGPLRQGLALSIFVLGK